MKKRIKKYIICLFLAANAVIMISCTAKDGQPVKAEAVGTKIVEKERNVTEEIKSESVAGDVTVLSVVSEPEGRDFLLYSENTYDIVFPEDFRIGPLQGRIGMDNTITELLENAEDFLDSILSNAPDYSFVVNDRIEFIKRNIEYELEQVLPTGYRIGLVNMSSDPVRAAVRLVGEEGSAEGALYFVKEGVWKIYDIQVDFSDIKESEEPMESDWYPSERVR